LNRAPVYRSEVGERLSRLALRGQWSEMPREISDEMLAEFAIVGATSELPAKLREVCRTAGP